MHMPSCDFIEILGGSWATDKHAFLVARHSKNLAVLCIYVWFPIILLCSPPALAHAGTAGAAKRQPLGVASMQTPENSSYKLWASHIVAIGSS